MILPTDSLRVCHALTEYETFRFRMFSFIALNTLFQFGIFKKKKMCISYKIWKRTLFTRLSFIFVPVLQSYSKLFKISNNHSFEISFQFNFI